MCFERGVQAPRLRRCRTPVADSVKLVQESVPVAVSPVIRELERVCASHDARSEHRRNKSRSFFVRPAHDFDRSPTVDLPIRKDPQHLETCQHSVDSVEPAAGRLSIEVAANEDRRRFRLRARANREDVAHLIDPDLAADLARPLCKLIARTTVLVRKGWSITPPEFRLADLCHRHERRPESIAICSQVLDRLTHCCKCTDWLRHAVSAETIAMHATMAAGADACLPVASRSAVAERGNNPATTPARLYASATPL